MRRDLIIGVIIALAVHGGVAYIGQLKKKGAPEKPKQIEEKLVQLKLPELEPEEPDPLDKDDEPVIQEQFVPPMLPDVPQPPQPEQFVQKIQPPPPDSLKPVTGAITIPTGKLSGMGEIFDPSKLDNIPTAKLQIKPEYPFEQRRQGVAGSVTVEFIVDANGNVPSAWTVKSTQKEFEKNAQAAVMRWKFVPGKKGGKNVATHMVVDIVFNLNDTNTK